MPVLASQGWLAQVSYHACTILLYIGSVNGTTIELLSDDLSLRKKLCLFFRMVRNMARFAPTLATQSHSFLSWYFSEVKRAEYRNIVKIVSHLIYRKDSLHCSRCPTFNLRFHCFGIGLKNVINHSISKRVPNFWISPPPPPPRRPLNRNSLTIYYWDLAGNLVKQAEKRLDFA